MQLVKNLNNWRAELSEAAQADLKKMLTIRKLKTNEILYSAGELPTTGFQIISGKVKVCNYHADGRELILALFKQGDCCGDLGLVSGIPRSNFAIACQETEVNVLKRSDFELLCKSHPEILFSVIKLLSYRVDYLLNYIEEANLLPVSERLAKILIRLGLSHGKKNQDGFMVIENISQEDIGRMVGATRQSIGTELKKMEANGIIVLEYSKLIIKDLDGMIKKYDNLISHETIIADYSESYPPKK